MKKPQSPLTLKKNNLASHQGPLTNPITFFEPRSIALVISTSETDQPTFKKKVLWNQGARPILRRLSRWTSSLYLPVSNIFLYLWVSWLGKTSKSLFIFLFFSFSFSLDLQLQGGAWESITWLCHNVTMVWRMVTSQVTVTRCHMTRVTWGPWENKHIATVVKCISR